MPTDAKVVQLNKVAPVHKPDLPAGRLPVVLVNLRDRAAQQFKPALQALFDNADDSLFQMADRATSNLEQNAFFEAMRDLRMKRRAVERSFMQRFFESFDTLNQYQIGTPAPQLEEIPLQSLTLVQNDELEETVAVDTMIGKVMSRNAVQLTHLTTRLNVLVTRKLDDKSNPLGPHNLCDCFLQARQSLGTDIRVKLIVLKLFEKYVLADLDQLYDEANQSLVAAGVLPELQTLPARARTPRPLARAAGPSMPAAFAGHVEEAQARELFGTLQSLLFEVRSQSPAPRERPKDAAPISSNDLLRLLSHVQARLPTDTTTSTEQKIGDLLTQLLNRASAKSGKSRVIGEVDEDVINLVGMLFEFILDDRNLPDSFKALIARMQIPVLKVAVLDKSLFGQPSHPARRLMNEIAAASMGWSDRDELQRDALYQKIEQIVARLISDFADDPAIFSELLTEFLAYIGNERRRSELIEQRTRDAEEGRARAELARQEVEHALNKRLLGRTLPEAVVRLLQEAWSKVLLLTCLKHGVQSEQWDSALGTMDDLVWSVLPHEDEQARARLLGLMPDLLRTLHEGLTSAAFAPFQTGEFFRELEQLHQQALKPQTQAEPAGSDKTIRQPATLDAASESALASLQASEPANAFIGPLPPTMVEVNKKIVLPPPGETREPEPEINLPDTDEHLQQVDILRVGCWVEFQEGEERKLRCKLAAVIKPTGNYVFVNRTGMKVMERTRMSLALALRDNVVRLLDDTLLFDRALESIIGNLRRLKAEV